MTAPGGPLADLAAVLRAAAHGVFPTPDGGWERARPWHRGIEGVVAMTGHAYLAVAPDLSDAELEAHGVDGLGGAHQPRVAELIRGSGWADTLDVLLVAPLPAHGGSAPGPDLVPREDLANHPRVAVAQQVRSGIRVLGMPSRGSGSVVTIATGVGGVVELGIQAQGDHTGRQLIDAALRWVGDELGDAEPLVASVPPGNARSLRLFLRAGFIPVGSVQLFRPERQPC